TKPRGSNSFARRSGNCTWRWLYAAAAPRRHRELPIVPGPAQPRHIWGWRLSKGGNNCHQRRHQRVASRDMQSEELGGAAKKINGPRTGYNQEHHTVNNGEAARRARWSALFRGNSIG